MDELYKFYETMKRSQAAAFNALASVPLFAFLDQVFFQADSFQNSAGIATDSPINESYAFKLMDIFEPRQGSIQQKIAGVLMQDAFVSDPMMKMFSQNAKKEQIKNILEKEKKLREYYASIIAENKAFSALEDAKDKQLQRLMAPELASSEGTSDDKQSSMQEVELAYLVGPKDLGSA